MLGINIEDVKNAIGLMQGHLIAIAVVLALVNRLLPVFFNQIPQIPDLPC